MNNKVIIAAILGGIIAFVRGFWSMVWLFKFYGCQYQVLQPVSWKEMGAETVYFLSVTWQTGLLIAYIFDKWANIRTLSTVLRQEAWMGLLVSISLDFSMYGTSNIMNMKAVLVDIVQDLSLPALVGAGVAWWLGRNKA